MMRALLMFLLLGFGPVHAQTVVTEPAITEPVPDWCVHDGTSVWQARRPAQNDLARITIDLRCSDGAVNGLRVKAETRCGRTLCTWSFAETATLEGASMRAVFLTFAATRSMRLDLSGDQLNVEVINDYNQPGRADDSAQAQLRLVD